MEKERYVYLLHFAAPVGHSQHYLGSAFDVLYRLKEHRRGEGARLTQVAYRRGIGMQIARTWKGDRGREREIKAAYKHAFRRLCPICTPGAGGHPRKFTYERDAHA